MILGDNSQQLNRKSSRRASIALIKPYKLWRILGHPAAGDEFNFSRQTDVLIADIPWCVRAKPVL